MSQSGRPTSLWEFISFQENQLLVNVRKHPQELDFYGGINQLYVKPIAALTDPESGLRQGFAVYSQLFHFSHSHYYLGMSLILRGHLSNGFHSLRTSIDAAFNAYLIMEGDATATDYINQERIFVSTIRTIKNKRDKDPSKYPFAPKLIEVHQLCGQFASHADMMVFAHRLKVERDTENVQLNLAYFQGVDVPAEHQLYLMSYLDSHIVILQIFEKVLRSANLVDQEWSDQLRAFGKAIVNGKAQLRKALNIPD